LFLGRTYWSELICSLGAKTSKSYRGKLFDSPESKSDKKGGII